MSADTTPAAIEALCERLWRKPNEHRCFDAAATLTALQSELAAVTAERDAMRDCIAGPAAWLNRWAQHVGSCAGDKLCTCGLAVARLESSAAVAVYERAALAGKAGA